jgi:hypothetical protein
MPAARSTTAPASLAKLLLHQLSALPHAVRLPAPSRRCMFRLCNSDANGMWVPPPGHRPSSGDPAAGSHVGLGNPGLGPAGWPCQG